jgi:cyclic pyranopterin phosphate synthase
MTTSLLDSYHRHIDYMRISVTDRCDLRCTYCTANRLEHLTHDDILRYEEIVRVVTAAASLGVKNIRLTGGEPMVRPNLVELIRLLHAVPGIEEISMTTNATSLAEHAQELKNAGLKRVNISLDTFKPERFARICGSDRIDRVLAGIKEARRVGLTPVKTNMVVLRGVNDDEVVAFARKTLTDGWNVRYIEEMPLTSDENANKMISADEIRSRIERELGGLEPAWPATGHGPAKYYRLPGADGSIGFIGAISHRFCDQCNRLRLTADGKLRPCLLRDDEIDLRAALRRGATTEELENLIVHAARLKKEHHEVGAAVNTMERQMWQIGG